MDHLLHLDTDVVCLLAKLNSYDYIIVGSGFGGGPLAEALASKQKKVLLIERGGVIFSTHVLNTSRPYYNRGASNSPEGNERVYDSVKAKVQLTDRSDAYVGGPVYCIGGRSNLWGTWIPEIGDETLNKYFPADIVKYLTTKEGDARGYDKAFSYLTDDDPRDGIYPEGDGDHEVSAQDIGAATEKLNTALEGAKFGIMPIAAQFNAPAPYKFAQGAYSTTLSIMNRMYANDPYLTVLLNTEVIATTYDPDSPNKRVNGLKIRDKSSCTIKDLEVGKAKIILSAGSIGTASIAINSGLQNLNPLVGQGLIDHNICYVRFAKQKDGGLEKPLNLKTHLKVGGEECLVTVTINANFFLSGSSASLNTTHFYRKDGTLLGPLKDPSDEQKNFDTICVLFEFVGKLDNENSVLSIPGMDPVLDIRRAPITHEVQCAMEEIILKVRDSFVDAKPTKSPKTGASLCPDPGLRPQHLGFGVFSHESGTMRMDGPQGDGVVDKNLKVKGVDNLWVCDMSIMPVSPEANPALTLAALSLRLAEHLSCDDI
ncbi:hypothetical protein FGRMN_2785 [Fusarium graminum]|nr:hypothetical protein FGRMN_2785 [Fusarium graminum]